MGLALALLGGQGWDQPKIAAALERAATRRLRLDAPVPVFLDYRTAGIDGDGRLELWPDIYGLDRQGVVRFPSKGLPPPEEPAPPQPVTADTVTVGDTVARPPEAEMTRQPPTGL